MGRGRGRNTIRIPHGAWGSKHTWQVTPGLPVTCSKLSLFVLHSVLLESAKKGSLLHMETL